MTGPGYLFESLLGQVLTIGYSLSGVLQAVMEAFIPNVRERTVCLSWFVALKPHVILCPCPHPARRIECLLLLEVHLFPFRVVGRPMIDEVLQL